MKGRYLGMGYVVMAFLLQLLISCDRGEAVGSSNQLNGTWGMVQYFDSIVEHKSVVKYRMQTPTWFAVLIEINDDTLKTFGSIERDVFIIASHSDSLSIITSRVTGDSWSLVKRDSHLILTQHPNSRRPDSTVYSFRKRDDLKHFTNENTDFFVIGNNVSEYFAQQLFKGKYRILESSLEVKFGDGGNIEGWPGYDRYTVRNYFGTFHPHQNLDVLTLEYSSEREYTQYYWRFNSDTLFLTEFVPETVEYKGEWHITDDMVLGENKLTFVKVN